MTDQIRKERHTQIDKPIPNVMTHYQGCWMHKDHHACALKEIERLGLQVSNLSKQVMEYRNRKN